MIYEVGDLARVSVVFTDSVTNMLADPTTVTVVVQAPDNSQSTYTISSSPAIVRDSTGKYHLDLPILQSGTYLYRWQGTGALQVVVEGSLTVQPTILVPQPVPYTSKGWSQADIDILDTAIKSGVLRVRFQEREVTYQSITDLIKARDFATSQVAAANHKIPVRQHRIFTTDGWGRS